MLLTWYDDYAKEEVGRDCPMRYTLMHKTIPVAELTLDSKLGVILSADVLHNAAHLPVGIPVTDGVPDYAKLTKWWTGRSIPASRSGLRQVLEKLKKCPPQSHEF